MNKPMKEAKGDGSKSEWDHEQGSKVKSPVGKDSQIDGGHSLQHVSYDSIVGTGLEK